MISFPAPPLSQGADEDLMIEIGGIVFPGSLKRQPGENRLRIFLVQVGRSRWRKSRITVISAWTPRFWSAGAVPSPTAFILGEATVMTKSDSVRPLVPVLSLFLGVLVDLRVHSVRPEQVGEAADGVLVCLRVLGVGDEDLGVSSGNGVHRRRLRGHDDSPSQRRDAGSGEKAPGAQGDMSALAGCASGATGVGQAVQRLNVPLRTRAREKSSMARLARLDS